MLKATPKLAIIAALEREIAPLVKRWTVTSVESQTPHNKDFPTRQRHRRLRGIGGISARLPPMRFGDTPMETSGCLSLRIRRGASRMKVGDICEPAAIIGDSDNNTIDTAGGKGKLVSAGAIAGVEHKRIFAGQL